MSASSTSTMSPGRSARKGRVAASAPEARPSAIMQNLCRFSATIGRPSLVNARTGASCPGSTSTSCTGSTRRRRWPIRSVRYDVFKTWERSGTSAVSVPPSGGLWGDRRGSGAVGAIGEIFGVYGQALTEGDPTDGLATVCRNRSAGGTTHRRSDRPDPRVGPHCTSVAHRGRSRRGDRRGPLRAHRVPGQRAQRRAATTLSTKAGDIDLRIPKLRKGSFFPLSLSPADASTRPCTRW